MSKAEEEEEEDNDQCRFHDSFDRLLSSSNTSCSGSPSAASEPGDDSDSVDPLVLQSYDVWMSQPLSVEERRVRLLRQMGLQPLGETDSNGDMNDTDNTSSNVCVNCDGSSNGGRLRCKSNEDCNSRSNGAGIDASNDNRSDLTSGRGVVRSISLNESSASSTAAPNKPPIGKIRGDGCRSNVSFSNLCAVSGDGECEERLECDGYIGVNPMCLIKNLDNGKEFVVDEVREDGMWEKIKEVGTGRRLTMDEFSSEMCVGTSPIVQELMRRQNVEDGNNEGLDSSEQGRSGSGSKKKRSWLKSIKNVASSVAGHRERRGTGEKDSSSEKGGRRSSSATDDSQDVPSHGPEKVRVKQYGKSVKELTALYKNQEVQAHNGSIWTIKFSLDGKYLASAGEDCVIHIWQVSETERKEEFLFDKADDGNFNILFLANGSPEPSIVSPNLGHFEKKKRRGRTSISRKSVCLEHILVPETVFSLSEKPICSFQGHLDDVLDLSWSKSQLLLSSSMDKTVRLWDLSGKTCLKIFSHSDYVTCIQFNPIDDGYFISGSLDAKVRIWSIPDHKVVDWIDLQEMVTAACYTPDGQGALIGSYKGSCRLYNTSDNKLRQKSQINLQNMNKKSHHKKITGFQFAPGSTSEVLITSADSRVRVINGFDLVHKFKGFRNTHSQISASLTSNGKYAISASEDSCVYVWRHESETQPNRSKGVTVTQSYEFFYCKDASVAIPWPGMSETLSSQDGSARGRDGNIEDTLTANNPTTPAEESNGVESSLFSSSPVNGTLSNGTNSFFFDKVSVTWPEERLLSITKNRSPRVSVDFTNGLCQNRSAWGMVIVTAGLRGEIRTFQNFGLPVRI